MVKIRLSAFILILFAIHFNTNEVYALVLDTERLCVKYETNQGWSQNYHVQVRTLKGDELNNATNSYNYNSFSHYAVIFWDDDQASIIELRYFTGSYGPVATRGKDQRGVEWQLSKKSICF